MLDTSEAIHPDAKGQQEVKSGLTLGRVTRVEVQGEALILWGERFNLAVKAINEQVMQWKVFYGNKPDWRTSAAMINRQEDGTLSAKQLKHSVTETTVLVTYGELTMNIDRQNGTFDVMQNGRKLFAMRSLIRHAEHQGDFTAQLTMESEDRLYGLGEKTGFLDKRGERYTMWNTDVYAPHVPEMEELYQSIPMMAVLRQGQAYGLFLDNPGRTVFDMRVHEDAFMIQTRTGDMDMYVYAGPDLKEVIRQYTEMTGRMPLPPKWSLGYHQSRYSYMNREEVMNLARSFREKQIPCDVIHLDIHYMTGYRVFTFDEERYPDPAGMMAELKEMGFHIVPIVDPGVKRDAKYPAYMEGIDNNYFCKYAEGQLYIGKVWPEESAFPDFTEERVRDWWGEKQSFYTDLGIEGIWNDMNEPAIFNETKTMDTEIVHGNDGNRKTHGEVHNLYGMNMSQATFEGLKKELKGNRPFVLTRAGYSGIQRYAAVWTGDNRSFWEHMSMAMPMVLNLGMSGVPFSGPDIGGFAHHTSGELLTRWTQMGVFFPFARNHSAIDMVRQEPWSFGDKYENIQREYISLRYRWMPYLYHWFHEASQTGLPIMRPLVLEYPNDPETFNLCDQFLVGDSVLVAPIYRPSTEWRSVYLPAGEWYDEWTRERLEGGCHIHAHAPIETMPLYVRAGSVRMEESLRQYAGEAIEDASVTACVYLKGEAGNYNLNWYEDDGLTYKYEEGAYNIVSTEVEQGADSVRIQMNYKHQGYEAKRSHINVRVIGLAEAPAQVQGAGEQLSEEALNQAASGWSWNVESKEVVVKCQDSASLLDAIIVLK
ncbi:TIM-barrel domain-containing protein [Paenibacillus agilis]|uniref:Glycoside hydrolase family 31 protein n=1 Tax=Paenibacillus agilis TaxID=3020863 RepID=A0A559IP14_9BACL|nr:TIM-barrel domain-containing protein [Paenibacillus agilis]TVX89391.1 glycoside hydrolase family 31 protein [Paenibacillus agilis]